MSGEAHTPEAADLATHAAFVRALARSLLLDPSRADDVAQQALLAAIEREERGIRRPRAWLATVTRNLVRRSYRTDRRRVRREQVAARPEAGPSAADLAARLETTERLVRAVRALREPFRETVMDGVRRWSIRARHPSYLPSENLTAKADDDLRLVLPRGRTVSGRVVDRHGRGVPGLWIEPAGGGPNVTRTGPDGSFVLGAIHESTPHLGVGFRVARMNGSPGGGVWGIIELEGDRGLVHELGTIRMVRVLVRDEEGRPFRHANLRARDVPSAGWGNPVLGDSGTDGEALFSAGATRRVEVTAVAPGREMVTGAVVLTGDEVVTEVTLTLRRPVRTGSLALSVHGADGSTLEHAFLTLSREDVALPEFRDRRVELDADGRAVLEGIPPGEYFAHVKGTSWPSAEGYLLDASREVRIESGAEAALDAELAVGGRVRVTVVNRRGEVVVPPWDITLRSRQGWLLTGHLVEIGPDLSFRSPAKPGPVRTSAPVAPGTAFVVIHVGTEVIARQEIEILPAREVDVRVPIDR